MPSEKVLDFYSFSHPVFDKFVAALDERLRCEARLHASVKSGNFEEIYAGLVAWDAAKTRNFISDTAFNVVGQPRMFDRLWDAVASYCGFLSNHGRPPTTALLLNDVLYHIKTTREITSPLRVFTSDKEFMKIYIAGVVGDSYNVETIDVIEIRGQIHRYPFPKSCVVKPTHMSGLYQCSESGSNRQEIGSWFDMNYYQFSREASYATLQPKVIVERFLDGYVEVKVICLFGIPKLLCSVIGGKVDRRVDYFTLDWERLAVLVPIPSFDGPIAKPKLLGEILEMSRLLSKKFNLVRVDFYTNEREIKVGEITHCDNGGGRVYRPKGAHELISKIIFDGWNGAAASRP